MMMTELVIEKFSIGVNVKADILIRNVWDKKKITI